MYGDYYTYIYYTSIHVPLKPQKATYLNPSMRSKQADYAGGIQVLHYLFTFKINGIFYWLIKKIDFDF